MPSHRSRRMPVSSDRRFKKNKSPTDFGTNELWQHSTRQWVKTDLSPVPVAAVLEESVIDVLVIQQVLLDEHRSAANKLKADFHAAAMSPHITSSYNPNGIKRDHFQERERSDGEEAAYQRWRRALLAIEPRHRNLMITVICCDTAPHRAEHDALYKACSQLAKWYGVGNS